MKKNYLLCWTVPKKMKVLLAFSCFPTYTDSVLLPGFPLHTRVGSSCLHWNPSFICTVCTVFGWCYWVQLGVGRSCSYCSPSFICHNRYLFFAMDIVKIFANLGMLHFFFWGTFSNIKKKLCKLLQVKNNNITTLWEKFVWTWPGRDHGEYTTVSYHVSVHHCKLVDSRLRGQNICF